MSGGGYLTARDACLPTFTSRAQASACNGRARLVCTCMPRVLRAGTPHRLNDMHGCQQPLLSWIAHYTLTEQAMFANEAKARRHELEAAEWRVRASEAHEQAWAQCARIVFRSIPSGLACCAQDSPPPLPWS